MKMEEELKKLEEEMEKKRLEIILRHEELNKYTRPQKLAILLHDKMCHHNHVDQCGWTYEFKDGKMVWEGYTHERYLKKANHVIQEMVLRGVDFESGYEVINSIFENVK